MTLDAVAADDHRARRHLADVVDSPARRRPGPAGRQRAGQPEDQRACCSSSSLGFAFGTGSMANLTARRRIAVARVMAVRAGAGAVHLCGMERRVLRRRGDPRPRAQRAAGAGAGHARRDRDLPAAERALSLRAAGGGAGGGARQRARRDRRSAARHQRRQHHGCRSRSSACWPASARWSSPGRASTTPWPATACSSRRRRGCTRASARRRRRSSRRACGAALLVLTGSANALTTYTGFSIILFNGVAVAALFVLRQREPHGRRARISTWGYPVVPGIFVAGLRAHRRQRAVDRPGRAADQRPADGAVGGRAADHRARACRSTPGSTRRGRQRAERPRRRRRTRNGRRDPPAVCRWCSGRRRVTASGSACRGR